MATIVLSAVGGAIGASVGGGVLGLSSVVIGRAIGASIGARMDQRLMGAGSAVVESGKVDRFRFTGASEGAPIAQLYGRMRIGGQVIWATRFSEAVSTSSTSGGKGVPSTTTTSYAYSTSLAIALCEGDIARVGRIWADGQEISPNDLNMRVYTGAQDQLPDPKMEAVEGAGNVPAYRGIAYVVIEDLALAPYGNRVPQFTFEVVRPEQVVTGTSAGVGVEPDLNAIVKGVSIIPGTGEYALATTPVYFEDGLGNVESTNVHSASGLTNYATALDDLVGELPNAKAASLVVSWFGDDLRCGSCSLRPKVEQNSLDGTQMPWTVSGLTRDTAQVLPRLPDDRVVYGGTPTDQSVIEAIVALKDADREVMFYPFILMDQMLGNTLIDPWTGVAGQPHLPWRGRITAALAPGVAGGPNATAAADAQVAAFFGTAQVDDFTQDGDRVGYSGPNEYSYRRMILHYAHLCALAGGVHSFCIGSEMRSLTTIQGVDGFPAVDALIALAADCRAILGPECKIGYAADWSEYFGYQYQGNLFYHLDPLWADANIDFVGIDNYMPISDWREGDDHADAAYGSIYNLDYLKAGIEGAEGYDWYYAHPNHAEAQIRTPIYDGLHGEDWIWRYKDIRSWWQNDHHNRVDGVRIETPSAWEPRMKPIWFTEIGCAAVDKGTNEPNKFLDPKSSESDLPAYSNGRRDDFIQLQYLRAQTQYWNDPDNNPVSDVYGGPMIDMDRAYVWAWDARPFPAFPNATSVWSDGINYTKGHWLNGRAGSRSLADVVAEICERSGVHDYDVSALWGVLRGYSVPNVTDARAALQPLMLAYGFDAIEREGKLIFRTQNGKPSVTVDEPNLARIDSLDGIIERTRAPEAEVAGRVGLTFVEADGSFAARTQEAIYPDEEARTVSLSELPLALTRSEGKQVVERWLAQSRVARDTARFVLPPSMGAYGAGDVVQIEEDAGPALYRIDHSTLDTARQVEAVRIEPANLEPSDAAEEIVEARAFAAPVPVFALFLDLPLLSESQVPHAPFVGAVANPWPGSAAVYASASDEGYTLNTLLPTWATFGVTQTALEPAVSGLWDRGAPLRVKLTRGALTSVTEDAVLNGANAVAIGDGTSGQWEVFQFAHAELVGAQTYDISLRLRGQAGTDALENGALPTWPIGARVVLLNEALSQIDLASSARGLARHYRIGPAQRGVADPSYKHRTEAFDGIGLRPYAPCHLHAARDAATGDLNVTWVRRTRLDGDSWVSVEVPLGEASEIYTTRVIKDGAVMRDDITVSPAWIYSAAHQTSDGVTAPFTIEVAQVSESFGAGLFTRILIND
ncbi:baseplate multidomain protein megatron [Celeribacter marinus]|uniref:baseplate multidomain protein megatron n=1 Tax=Celeribacter marinus TaxID=1397108 RepID=UPI00317028A5